MMTENEWRFWTAGLKMLVQRQKTPDLFFVQQAYARLKKPRLTLNQTVALLEEINFRAPKELIKVKFDVSDLMWSWPSVLIVQ